jgi:hypothetical protein
MQPSQQLSLVCPECSTRLRLSSADVPEDEFQCPDCSALLRVEKSDSGDPRLLSTFAASDLTSQAPKLKRFVWITLAATTGTAILILAFVFSGDSNREVASPEDAPATTPDSVVAVATMDPAPADDTAREDLQLASPRDDSLDNPLVELTDQIKIPVLGTPAIPSESSISNAPAARIPAAIDAPNGDSIVDKSAVVPGEPVVSPVVERPRRLSFEERLGIEIPSFEQKEPAPLSGLIEVLEQLVQVRIDVDDLPIGMRTKPVSFSLKATTPLQILVESARLAGARPIIDKESESIRLVPDDR